jgi:hypothetical protein
VVDGDSAKPGKPYKGKPSRAPKDKPGFPGHWVFAFGGSNEPKVLNADLSSYILDKGRCSVRRLHSDHWRCCRQRGGNPRRIPELSRHHLARHAPRWAYRVQRYRPRRAAKGTRRAGVTLVRCRSSRRRGPRCAHATSYGGRPVAPRYRCRAPGPAGSDGTPGARTARAGIHSRRARYTARPRRSPAAPGCDCRPAATPGRSSNDRQGGRQHVCGHDRSGLDWTRISRAHGYLV